MTRERKSVHVIVSGRVQGVGYRAWMHRTAAGLGLDGWVRNRRDGSVEGVIAGERTAVDDMLRRLRDGPAPASVTNVAETARSEPVDAGFTVLPTA